VTLGTKKYYVIAGMTVAVNDGSGLQYLLTDHLGSVVAVTNASGTLTSQQRYLPFGQVRADIPSIPNSPITQTDFGFTGQRNLDGLGLMDYHARMYDAALGRFIQPDTIIPSMANPQSFNRFSYVLNNSVNATDPTGHHCDEDLNGHCIISGNSGGGGGTGDDWYNNGSGSNVPIHHTDLIGSSSGMFPNGGSQSYGQTAEETSCPKCSIEGPDGKIKDVAGGIGALADLGNGIQLNSVLHRSSTIFVYLNYTTYPNGNFSADSLTINNQSYGDYAVTDVAFVVKNPNALPQTYQYNVQRSYWTAPSNNKSPGVGLINENGLSTISLTPSNNRYNEYNTFSSNDIVKVVVSLGSYGYNNLNLYPFHYQLP
jgi:RHS repeat-associated protein